MGIVVEIVPGARQMWHLGVDLGQRERHVSTPLDKLLVERPDDLFSFNKRQPRRVRVGIDSSVDLAGDPPQDQDMERNGHD
jgi:hypothetical protein